MPPFPLPAARSPPCLCVHLLCPSPLTAFGAPVSGWFFQTARHRLEPLDQQLYRFRRRSPITEGLDTESAVWSYVESDQILRICRICVTVGGTRRGKVVGARQLHSLSAGSAACQSPPAPPMSMQRSFAWALYASGPDACCVLASVRVSFACHYRPAGAAAD